MPRCRPAVLIGYARVSFKDQQFDLQRNALAKLGCRGVVEDCASR